MVSRLFWFCIVTAVLALTLALPVAATKPSDGGETSQLQFGMTAYPSEQTDSTGLFGLWLEYGSRTHTDSTLGTARVSVGPGARMTQGDSVFTVHPARFGRAKMTLLKTGPGPVTIKTSLFVPTGPRSSDFSEGSLVLAFEGSKIRILRNDPVRRFVVRDGRRFRYGGLYFVAIDDEEVEDPQSYQSRAEVLTAPEVKCPKCGLAGAVDVPVVVTVGRRGTVTWVRPRPMPGGPPEPVRWDHVDDRVWTAVEKRLKDFRCRAAMSEGHPVPDYAITTVRVVPSR